MKKIKRTTCFLFLLLTGIICMLTACSKPDELIYYKTICEGYVYDATNNVPLKGVTIEMRNFF